MRLFAQHTHLHLSFTCWNGFFTHAGFATQRKMSKCVLVPGYLKLFKMKNAALISEEANSLKVDSDIPLIKWVSH